MPSLASRPGKIAVLRANGLGDFIFTLPALAALRQTFPEAELVLLGKEWHGPFLEGRGVVDRVVAVPEAEAVLSGRCDLARIEPFFQTMQAERFDLALQLYGGGRYSNPFVKRLGATLTAGLRTPDAEALDLDLPYVYFQNEVLRYLEVVAQLGTLPVHPEPRLPVIERDLREAEGLGLDLARTAFLHPGATDPRRHWPADRFAKLADELCSRGFEVAIVGSESDRAQAEAILALAGPQVRDLTGRLSLSGLAGALSRCRVMIGNDSGPLHLAAAVGAAGVGLYWCSNLLLGGRADRRRHRPLVSWRTTCPACGGDLIRLACQHQVSWLEDIAVDDVLQAVRELTSD